MLVAHAAAGLCTVARCVAAARLLRSAEATARAAVALLVAPPAGQPATPASVGPSLPAAPPPAGTRSSRRRLRRKKNNEKADLDSRADAKVAPCVPLVPTAPALSAEAAAVCRGAAARVLKAHSSRERSPPPSRTSSSSAQALPSAAHGVDARLPAGATVTFANLVSRPELVGMAGVVLSFDEATSRYAVKVVGSGESTRVLPRNLTKS